MKPLNNLSSFLILLGALFFLTCASPYEATDFYQQTQDHEVIAVLPFEMVFTGVMPEKFTEADVLHIEESESKAFQVSFYNELLASTKRGKKALRVDVQDYRKTWRLLRDAKIGLRESWDKSPEELAAILGVDAVVRARIKKHRLMSDLESFGIDVGLHVIDILTFHHTGMWWRNRLTTAKEIFADYTVLDAKAGMVLWSVSFEEEADWQMESRDIIKNINHRAARHFPYRAKDSQELALRN